MRDASRLFPLAWTRNPFPENGIEEDERAGERGVLEGMARAKEGERDRRREERIGREGVMERG